MISLIRIYLLLLFALIINQNVLQAQIDGDAIFSLPKLTNSEMLSVTTPYLGSMVYNTDDNSIYKFNGTTWINTELVNALKAIVLNRAQGYTLPNATNTYYDFPIDANHIQSIDTDVFTVTGNGAITVSQAGVYLISAELSTSNMPAGATKYILAFFVNGTLRGYLSRGFANLPSVDWWGATGVLMYNLNANDEVTIRYVLNAGGTLTGRLMNIGMTKIK